MISPCNKMQISRQLTYTKKPQTAVLLYDRKLMFSSLFSHFPEAAESPPMAMPATLPPPSPCKEVVFYEPKEYSPGLQLYWASCARSLPDMAEALAHGAEVNWVNTEDDKRTPLIMAVQGVSVSKDNTLSAQYYFLVVLFLMTILLSRSLS